MKIKDLPKDMDLLSVLIKVPAKALKHFKSYAGGEATMYCVGPTMGYGFMMSPDPPAADERRLYPLPPEVSTSDILEWRLASPSEQRN